MSKKNLGKAFENLIEAANQQYFISGAAAIEKQELQAKQINGRMVYTKKGPPDFMGVVKGGQGIAFDAKSTRGKSLPLKNILDRRHQLEFLQKYERLGGIAFYLVEFVDARRVFILPISQVVNAIKEAENGGRKSIPLDEFKLEARASFHCALDYLAAFQPVQISGVKTQFINGERIT